MKFYHMCSETPNPRNKPRYTALKLYETKEIWKILQQSFYLIYSIFYLMSVQSFSNKEHDFLIYLPQNKCFLSIKRRNLLGYV